MNGKCFRVSGNAAETQYTWYEARQSCAAEGGDLATFTSLEEQMFVVNKVQAEQIWTHFEVQFLPAKIWVYLAQICVFLSKMLVF